MGSLLLSRLSRFTAGIDSESLEIVLPTLSQTASRSLNILHCSNLATDIVF